MRDFVQKFKVALANLEAAQPRAAEKAEPKAPEPRSDAPKAVPAASMAPVPVAAAAPAPLPKSPAAQPRSPHQPAPTSPGGADADEEDEDGAAGTAAQTAAASAASASSKILREGLMDKLSGGKRVKAKWDLRYFVLRDDGICTYMKHEGSKPVRVP